MKNNISPMHVDRALGMEVLGKMKCKNSEETQFRILISRINIIQALQTEVLLSQTKVMNLNM